MDKLGQNVDKKTGQIEKIDKRVLNYQVKQEMRAAIHQIMEREFLAAPGTDQMQATLKADRSVVTKIDLLVSEKVKEILQQHGHGSLTFFSEEDHGALRFPAVVLDPIDGTKELIRGIPECTLSLAILHSADYQGEGWIYNPFTSFEIDNLSPFITPWCRRLRPPLGFVSQSEWDDGLYQHDLGQSGLTLSPRGSMANKLFLMSVGACEFVVTKRPKSLWDIAAGALILHRQGALFFQGNEQVKYLDQVEFGGDRPLIWVRPECREQVLGHFINEK